MGGLQDQMAAMQENANAMGRAFDAAKNDDSFISRRRCSTTEFKARHEMFISPDGKSVRFIISHENDPPPAGTGAGRQDQECRVRVDQGTPLEGSKVYLGGTASAYWDIRHGASYDLLIAGLAFCSA